MSKKSFGWEEVAKHNTAESAWIAVDGKVYDVTKFVDNHPGGREIFLSAAGRDCTDLIKSYHPFTDKPYSILPKYEIGTLSSYELNRFKPDTGFYKECCERVKKYFETNKLNSKDPLPGLVRLAFLLFTMAFTFSLFNNILPSNGLVKFLAAAIFGSCQALILVHQMHDASHTAIGKSPLWWKAIGQFTMEWVAGASFLSWHHQHVLGHHLYTNIMGADPDLPMSEEGDMRYLVPRQSWLKKYQLQHLYMPILYGLLGLKFRIQDFTWTFGAQRNGPIRVNPLATEQWVNLVATKSWWIFYRIVVPLFFLKVSLAEVLFYFIITELATGYYLAFNFQVSHISTAAFFPCDKKFQHELQDEWAVVQVITSVDYAHGNPMVAFLTGALNYQTVHHLFPCVSQYHYPAIAPIIIDVCKKYNVPFNHIPTFSEALMAHFNYLYKMGNKL
eukprot:TRINITY_DN211_c1_g1_i1.p1 TRINITY_DN211_c1_g1~~TRINITY_DN211_c1_g1_i1.p1  ORF type:complete len:445 (-),score=95.61 TRINITY_DN211_c1_g1_i1:160-1494(-)